MNRARAAPGRSTSAAVQHENHRRLRAERVPGEGLDGSPASGDNHAVLVALVRRARAAVAATVERVFTAVRDGAPPTADGRRTLNDLVRSKRELLAENAILRQQLIVAARSVRRPAFRPHERGLSVVLASIASNWRDTMLPVKPDTIVRWHRERFRLLWRRKSKPRIAAPERLASGTIDLIRRLAKENRLWGAERIRGELLKLGLRVSKRTVQRYMRGPRPAAPPRGQSWHAFLRNHTVWACVVSQILGRELGL